MQPIEIEQALKSLQMVQTLMFYTEGPIKYHYD